MYYSIASFAPGGVSLLQLSGGNANSLAPAEEGVRGGGKLRSGKLVFNGQSNLVDNLSSVGSYNGATK
jgi:hypothetical protein